MTGIVGEPRTTVVWNVFSFEYRFNERGILTGSIEHDSHVVGVLLRNRIEDDVDDCGR